jgi:phosphoglycolate phosphatase-like HAD superfamily hydrolase
MEGKAGAVEHLLEGTGVETVAFAGDDRTDLDAAIRLREMKDRGEIARLILVAVASEEGPPELVEMADIVLDDPDEWLDLVEFLAVGESS